jgi:cation:H+ antiporter
MTDELIGLTVVAVATSLPELATSLQAVRRGTVDIAVGNVVGSNIFNILLVMGATSVVGSVAVPAGGWVSLCVMALLSVLLLPMSRIRGRTISRLEGVLLLGSYGLFMVWSVWSAL